MTLFFTRKTYWLSLSLFFVLFIGDSLLFGFPLILAALLLVLIFALDIKLSFTQISFLLITVSIFIYQAIALEETRNPLYPLWILSFLLSFIFSTTIIRKLELEPYSTLQMMAYALIPILLLFSIGILFNFNEAEARSLFIFGPNMLYRVIGFLMAIGGGYLFYKGDRFAALSLSFLSYYVLLLTGSRASIFVILVTLLLFLHLYQRKISFLNFSLMATLISVPFFLLNIDLIGFSRVFNYQSIDFATSDYVDAYSRFRPFLYFIFETDRLSIIGITHEEFLDLFYTTGYYYPHNMFLELIIYYGWFGVLVTSIILYKLFQIGWNISRNAINPYIIFCYSLVILFFGTMFSGDMGDNGAVLGALFAIFWSDRAIKSGLY
jgi:hypothetical protein